MITLKKLIIFICIFMTLFIFNSCSINQEKKDEQCLKNTIENYFESFYQSWYELKFEEYSEILDLDSIQSYNKTIALRENIERWSYAMEKGYTSIQREKHSLNYKYNLITISEDSAVVEVNLSGEHSNMEAYPYFITLGKNIFKLKKHDNVWKIYEHIYESEYFFEKSNTEKLIFDIDQIHNEVDRDYQ